MSNHYTRRTFLTGASLTCATLSVGRLWADTADQSVNLGQNPPVPTTEQQQTLRNFLTHAVYRREDIDRFLSGIEQPCLPIKQNLLA